MRPLTFSELLNKFRERADLSMNQLARAICVDPSYVSRLERGEREPPRRPVVIALAAAMRLDGHDAEDFLMAAGYVADGWREQVAQSRVLVDDAVSKQRVGPYTILVTREPPPKCNGFRDFGQTAHCPGCPDYQDCQEIAQDRVVSTRVPVTTTHGSWEKPQPSKARRREDPE